MLTHSLKICAHHSVQSIQMHSSLSLVESLVMDRQLTVYHQMKVEANVRELSPEC